MSAIRMTVERGATLSICGTYRYRLSRQWNQGLDVSGRGVWYDDIRWATFIMLNPSTADAEVDDPTIRRCVGFAQEFGCNGLLVANLYAYRATNPRDLWSVDFAQRVGPDNDRHITSCATLARETGGPVIAAWGANAEAKRVEQVLALPGVGGLSALGVTKGGQPRHPLYLRGDSMPLPWPSGGAS